MLADSLFARPQPIFPIHKRKSEQREFPCRRNPNQQGGGGKQQDSRSFRNLRAGVPGDAAGAAVLPAQKNLNRSRREESNNRARQRVRRRWRLIQAPIPTTPPRRLERQQLLPVAAAAEQTTTVENENYRIVFTNRGAQVNSWC